MTEDNLERCNTERVQSKARQMILREIRCSRYDMEKARAIQYLDIFLSFNNQFEELSYMSTF
jgi:hypothetical protein